MLFTTVLTSALAGLAMASPAARMDQSINGLQQRVSFSLLDHMCSKRRFSLLTK